MDVVAKITREVTAPGIVFHQLSAGNFQGGYFLNERLPYNPDDLHFADEENDILVLMSGTIFNREELASVAGVSRNIASPGLVARLFISEGPGFVDRLNGDFAISVVRPKGGRLYLFRDHVGIRPLAYSVVGSSLLFSTNVTALCRAVSEGKEIDTTWLTGHFRYIDYRLTPSAKVKKLMPGSWLLFREGGVETVRYWRPETIRADRRMGYEQMLSEVSHLVHDAVVIRCDSRFNAGAHVSGGLDSGAVAVMARNRYAEQKEFFGFSWSPGDYDSIEGKADERVMVQKTCEPAGITAVMAETDMSSFPALVADYYNNSVFFSERGTLRQITGRGVNLIFSGWGGDEFISTGAGAIEADLLRQLHLGLYLRRNGFPRPRLFYYNFTRWFLFPLLHIHDRGTAKAFRDDTRYLKKEFKKSDRRAIKQFYFNVSRRSHHLGMLNFYHLQERCESWYETGYREGVEYRYPLLDKRIVEYMLRVPSLLLTKTSYRRQLLREAVKGILNEEVRMGSMKNDPVYWTYMKELWREAALLFMDEVPQWKSNPDLLRFVDFDTLQSDITASRSGTPAIDDDVLARAMVYLKALDAFTRRYRADDSVAVEGQAVEMERRQSFGSESAAVED